MGSSSKNLSKWLCGKVAVWEVVADTAAPRTTHGWNLWESSTRIDGLLPTRINRMRRTKGILISKCIFFTFFIKYFFLVCVLMESFFIWMLWTNLPEIFGYSNGKMNHEIYISYRKQWNILNFSFQQCIKYIQANEITMVLERGHAHSVHRLNLGILFH